MAGGEYRVIAAFGRTRNDVAMRDTLLLPLVQMDEIDPVVVLLGGWYTTGYGSVLARSTGPVDFTVPELGGDNCYGQLHFDLTVNRTTFTNL